MLIILTLCKKVTLLENLVGPKSRHPWPKCHDCGAKLQKAEMTWSRSGKRPKWKEAKVTCIRLDRDIHHGEKISSIADRALVAQLALYPTWVFAKILVQTPRNLRIHILRTCSQTPRLISWTDFMPGLFMDLNNSPSLSSTSATSTFSSSSDHLLLQSACTSMCRHIWLTYRWFWNNQSIIVIIIIIITTSSDHLTLGVTRPFFSDSDTSSSPSREFKKAMSFSAILSCVELSLLVFYVTCNDISVIYVTAQMCRRIEEVVPTVGLPTKYISQGPLRADPSHSVFGYISFKFEILH